ncbi:NADH:flavin oxidoreductase/NADH oxidase family protein [uncultured Abyssibacter sp.]|uniref:NADH:flavin oxidoreductase/NADH oxidase family protein n=1 Tax=uncultured Abyssibacter sp. TaxID=2320202 RepID=UPI0032B29A5A
MAEITLNTSFTLSNGTVVPNRIAKSAMSEALGTADNRVTDELVELYRRWGAGGTGLLITGNVMIDRKALGEPGNVVIEDERDLDKLAAWAEAGKAQGAQIWVQLNHPGRQCPKGLNEETVAPSPVPFNKSMQAYFETPRELTGEEIEDIIARFGRAAGICYKAGFTGVQIHGAHGYLVSQFLSPKTNQRTDEWGGSAEARRHFVLRVLAAMRGATAPDFPIGIKLNSADFQRGGFTEDESLDVMAALADAGIALIEISGGTYEAPAMTGARASTREREAYFLDFADKVRARITGTPLMVTGGFRTHAGMTAALASGSLDLCGIARLLAIEPDVSKRLLAGQDPLQTVRPIKTGIGPVDRMAIMEVTWYTRQLRRIGRGKAPKPGESGLKAFLCSLVDTASGMRRTRRLRASG